MKTKIIFILVLVFASLVSNASNYKVIIKGIMVDVVGTPIPKQKVRIYTPDAQKFSHKDVDTTDINGKVSFEVEVPDSVPAGFFIIEFEKCTGRMTSGELAFSKQKNEIAVKLIYCETPVKECKSVITLKKITDTVGMAIVSKKGIAPFTVRWTNGSMKDTIRYNLNITAKYCVYVQDSAGCISESCFQNEAPCSSKIEVKKLSDTSAICIVIAKGKSPFKYLWTTGSTNDTIRFNPQNKIRICVAVKDANGCISESCLPNTVNCDIEIFNSGNILTAKLKSIPITTPNEIIIFQWSTGQNSRSIEVKEEGTYCVKVLTLNGCSSSACFKYVPKDTCKGVVTIKKIENTLVASITSDTAVKFYWSNGEDGPRITIKEAGTYCVKVQGKSGCFYKECFEIIDSSECRAEIVADRLGSTNQDVVPGVKLQIKANFKLKFIAWNTGEKSETIIVRKSGEYCAVISDLERCKMIVCKKVEVAPEDCDLAIVQELTSDKKQAILSFKFTSNPKIIVWSTNETSQRILVTKSGEYCLTVSDDVSCKKRVCVNVKLDSLPKTECEALIMVTPISNKEVSLQAKLTGKSPIKFEWNTGSSEAIIKVVRSGQYCVKMLDGSGCTARTCVDINIVGTVPGIVDGNQKIANQDEQKSLNTIKLDVFPNPSGNYVNYNYLSVLDGKSTISISNMVGRKVYEEDITVIKKNGNGSIDISHLPVGLYQLAIRQDGIITSTKLVISR